MYKPYQTTFNVNHDLTFKEVLAAIKVISRNMHFTCDEMGKRSNMNGGKLDVDLYVNLMGNLNILKRYFDGDHVAKNVLKELIYRSCCCNANVFISEKLANVINCCLCKKNCKIYCLTSQILK